MNSFKYYLFAGFVLFPLLLQSQIHNVRVFAEGEQIILITYDYVAQDESIDDIIVNYSYVTDDGTKEKEARLVTGDVQEITPGVGKRIEWDPYGEIPNFSPEKLREIRLAGFRDPTKQAECDASLKTANQFFAEGKRTSYKNAASYYREMLDCSSCNCHPKDIRYATEQLRISNIKDKILNAKDKFHISYLFDMATAEGGSNLHGMSAFLLRNGGVGSYASFRTDNSFYSSQDNMSYYDDETHKNNYELGYSDNQRISSWLFSTGLTFKLIGLEYGSGYLYGGVGLGTNGIARKYSVTERGYTDSLWITDGVKNLFFSPEVGIIANIYDYFSVTAGIKYPIPIMTSNADLKMKGLSAMVGIGIKLKSIEKGSYTRNNTYVAYTMDLPDKSGPDRLQSINIIGISIGTVSYHKPGTYFSARINPLLFNPEKESNLTDNSVYTGVYDYANAFGTVGLTWMYFYGGIGVSYQKEYKEYNAEGGKIWNSERNNFGLCTEFGVNLRLFDRLLLRVGATFPDFKLSSKDDKFTMGSNKTFLSLGLGYVLSN